MTQLEQISDIGKSVYLIVGELGSTAGKVKNLEREHYSAGELDALYRAIFNTVVTLRGCAAFESDNNDRSIAYRFDMCAIEASAGVTAQQSQLQQIDSLRADVKAVNNMLKQLTLDIEQLKADHPKTPAIDALNWAAKDALKEYRRVNAPLRAIRKDATFTNGITAADGMAGAYKAFNRLDSATTNKPQAKTGADYES